MKPKKYPYLGAIKAKKTTKKEDKPEFVVFPNVSLRKDLLKHIYSVVKQRDNTTIIYFRIPKVFGLGYDDERARINLSYEETMKILNSC